METREVVRKSCGRGESEPTPADHRLEPRLGVSTSHRPTATSFYTGNRRRKPITAYTHAALKRLTYEQRLEVPGYQEAFDAAAQRERDMHPDPFEGLAEPGRFR